MALRHAVKRSISCYRLFAGRANAPGTMNRLHQSISATRLAAAGKAAYPHGMECLSPGATTIAEALTRLGPGMEEVPLEGGKSNYVKAKTLYFELDGKRRRWDAVESHGSIGVVLYHTERKAFIIVRQFRPAVYASAVRTANEAAQQTGAPPSKVDLAEGFTFELCAGILDKDKSLEEICREEIEEETGFGVPTSKIQYIGSTISSSGTAGARHYMFYADVDESMRVNQGGGLADHGEMIEVLSVPLDSVDAFVVDDACNKSPGLMFGLIWAAARVRDGRLGGGAAGTLANDTLTLKSVPPA